MAQIFARALRLAESSPKSDGMFFRDSECFATTILSFNERTTIIQQEAKIANQLINSAKFCSYQVFFSRSFLHAVAPWLVMTCCEPPMIDRSIIINDDKDRNKTLQDGKIDYKNYIPEVEYTDSHPRLGQLDFRFVDPKILSIFASFCDTFKFVLRLSFFGITNSLRESASVTHHEIFKNILLKVDFQNLVHLDFCGVDHLSEDMLLEILSSQPPSSSSFRRPQLLQSLDISGTSIGASRNVDQVARIFNDLFPFLRKLTARRQHSDRGVTICKAFIKSKFLCSRLEILDLSASCLDRDALEQAFTASTWCKLRKLFLDRASLSEPLNNTGGGNYHPTNNQGSQRQQQQSFNFDLLKKCPLEIFSIQETLIVNEEMLAKVIDNIGDNLRVLRIGRTIGKVSEAFFKDHLFAKCPFLVLLDLDDLAGLTPGLLKLLPKRLPHLRSLDISDNWNLSKVDRKKVEMAYEGRCSVQQIFYDITSDGESTGSVSPFSDELEDDDEG